MSPLSFAVFRDALEQTARREHGRAEGQPMLALFGEAPAGVIARLRRDDCARLDEVGKATLATECALALGRVRAIKAALTAPLVGERERRLLLVAERGRAEALIATEDEPGELGAWQGPTVHVEGLFVDGLDDGLVRQPCPNCGAAIGWPHSEWCDVARCGRCRRQHLLCGCDAPAELWAGAWPGLYECRALGLFARRSAAGWAACEAGVPGAREDLNRLAEYWATRVE